VNQKPTGGADAASASPTAAPTPSASPTATPEPENENLLPSIFPTFGVSRRTQIWIYGSLALILIFVSGLGAYFYIARRKQQKSSRDAYEFEVLDDVEDREETGMLSGAAAAKKKGRAKRGGELYDAFAGESDEDLLSDSDGGDEGPYRDQERYNEKYGRAGDAGSDASGSEAGRRKE
jgi:kexin